MIVSSKNNSWLVLEGASLEVPFGRLLMDVSMDILTLFSIIWFQSILLLNLTYLVLTWPLVFEMDVMWVYNTFELIMVMNTMHSSNPTLHKHFSTRREWIKNNSSIVEQWVSLCKAEEGNNVHFIRWNPATLNCCGGDVTTSLCLVLASFRRAFCTQ